MPSKAIIVGYEWHEFQGDGLYCAGIIGDGSDRICGQTEHSDIHSDDMKPQWMKDATSTKEELLVCDVDGKQPKFELSIRLWW